ncbi:MAG: hypothetical protein U0V75_00060 [Ferruginibacter sp.]
MLGFTFVSTTELILSSKGLPFIARFICVVLWQKSVNPEKNFGDSKGLTYDRVIIYPTKTIANYLLDGKLVKKVKNKKGVVEEQDAFDIAKFYVALTRARYSVAIVYDYKDSDSFIDGIVKYSQRET